MAAPFNKVRSKLARAIAAYLISVEAGTDKDTAAANSTKLSEYPLTTVKPTVAVPDPPMSGLYRIPVHISIKGRATKRKDGADPRVLFDERVGAVIDAMMQSDDGETLRVTAEAITAAGRALAVSDPEHNADMADFTCQALYDGGFGDGEADEEGTDWEEILIFNALACGSNTD